MNNLFLGRLHCNLSCMEGYLLLYTRVGWVISHEFFYLLRYRVFSWDVSVLRSCSTFDRYHIFVLLPGRSHSRSVSRSRSPPYHSVSRGGHHSRYIVNAVHLSHFLLIFTEARWFIWMLMSLLFRSYSPSPRRREEYSASPTRRPVDKSGSPWDSPRGDVRRSYTPDHDNGYDKLFCCYFLGLIDTHSLIRCELFYFLRLFFNN